MPFEIPEGWSWCTLYELTTSIGDGLHGTPKFDDNGEYYFVNGNNLDGIISIKKETKRTTIDEYTKQGLKFNSQTIFVSINGTLGNIAFYNNEPIVLGKSACYINLLDGISKEYIATILRCQYFLNYCRDTATGSTIKNVPLAAMRSLFIPIPSYQEQLRIVDEVEKLLTIVDNIEQSKQDLSTAISQTKNRILDLAIHGKLVPQDANDEPASELLKRINPKAEITCDNGHYQNLPFEVPQKWSWTTLGKIGKWQSGSTPSRLNKDYYNGDIPWLKTGDLNDGYITHISEYITEKALNETSVKLNPSGSVLIAMYGATIGKIGILTYPATTNQACCACSEFKGIYNMYLFYYLLSHRDIFIMMGGGGAQPNISKEKITETLIPLPPLSEQKRIVAKIEELFAVIDRINISLKR